MPKTPASAICAALLLTALAALGPVSGASAHLTGLFTTFEQCPWRDPEVKRCTYGLIGGGAITIGGAETPLVNPTVLQGGYGKAGEDRFASLLGAVNGETLSRAPQPLPGGLSGMLSGGESRLLDLLGEALARNEALDELDVSMELAGPASDIKVSESHISRREGAGIVMPTRLHIENPLIGPGCYIGSEREPIVFELTTGTTDPPPPNEPIGGMAGTIHFLEGGLILQTTGMKLVDNAWAVPAASGCGITLDRLIDERLGLPSPAGRNTVVLEVDQEITTAAALRLNDEENPDEPPESATSVERGQTQAASPQPQPQLPGRPRQSRPQVRTDEGRRYGRRLHRHRRHRHRRHVRRHRRSLRHSGSRRRPAALDAVSASAPRGWRPGARSGEGMRRAPTGSL